MRISDWSSAVCSSDLRHRHVANLELVDRLHAEILEAEHLGRADRLGDQIRGAADRHQIRALVLLDRFDRDRATLGLADHRDQSRLGQHRSEEHTSELQSLMRNSYAVFCLKKKNTKITPVNKSTHKHNTRIPVQKTE